MTKIRDISDRDRSQKIRVNLLNFSTQPEFSRLFFFLVKRSVSRKKGYIENSTANAQSFDR